MRTPTLITISNTLASLLRSDSSYACVIDVRSPSEYADDHIPNSINLPVLTDQQRHEVGLAHKEHGAFVGSRLGAPFVSANIASHLTNVLNDKPRDWRPLVYCWRGGQRSNSLATVLARVGWQTDLLEGGYRAYRRSIIQFLEHLPPLDFRVVTGRTGSAKSRLLSTLSARGQQVLDLEGLAQHKGSVLGDLPHESQPSQRLFESRLAAALAKFDFARPVYVESESKKIGKVHIPDPLMKNIRSGKIIKVNASVHWRADFLLNDYDYFVKAQDQLFAQLDCLIPLHGHEKISGWKSLAKQGEWVKFVSALLTDHYDPAYDRAIGKNYTQSHYSDVTLHGELSTTLGLAANQIIGANP
jgi:tRNA 2-selenouridine synthase